MIRCRPHLAHLLGLLLLLQWETAVVHCLRQIAVVGGTHSVEICRGDGLTTVVLDDDGRPVPKSAASHGVCPGCCGPVASEPPLPPQLIVPVAWPAEAPVPTREGLPVAPARAPPQQPRAPPLT